MNYDCYYYIIKFLYIKDNNNMALVNKKFYNMARSDLIWKVFCDRDFYNVECGMMFYHKL